MTGRVLGMPGAHGARSAHAPVELCVQVLLSPVPGPGRPSGSRDDLLVAEAHARLRDAAVQLRQVIAMFAREAPRLTTSQREAALLLVRAHELTLEDFAERLALLVRRRVPPGPAGVLLLDAAAAPGWLDAGSTVRLTLHGGPAQDGAARLS